MDPSATRIAELERENAALRKRVAELETLVAALQKHVEELERKLAQSTARFSKGKKIGICKKPGRRKGEGTFTRRSEAADKDVTETRFAPVTEDHCPCGGAWARSTEIVTTTDIPANVRPEVVKTLVEICTCTKCGRKVRGTHPNVPADQCGATAHRIGTRTMALGHFLNADVGIPMRQVPRVIEAITGVKITQSALTQDGQHRAEGDLKPVYEGLKHDVAAAPVVNTDDTSWRVAGTPANLMNFNTPETSVFQIRFVHRNEEVREVIPATFPGVLGTDRFSSYDAKELANVKQQKCNGHILRNIAEEMEHQPPRARWLGRLLSDLFRRGIHLHNELKRGHVTAEQYHQHGKQIHEQLTHWLRPRSLADAANQRMLDGLRWHHERGNLLRYLDDPRIEPTNNSSERDLRGAVKARKVSHCSKNLRGAECHSTMLSLGHTIRKRVNDVRSVVKGWVDVFTKAVLPPKTRPVPMMS